MISRSHQLGGCCEWRPTLSTVPSTLLYAKIYFKSLINVPFDVGVQNVQFLIVLQNKQQKESQGKKPKLNLKIKINQLYLNLIIYNSARLLCTYINVIHYS